MKLAKLTTVESNALALHESVIAAGLVTFIEVGSALLSIREGKLYRATHKTFEAYCTARWGMAKSQAYRLIAAVGVIENLSPQGDVLPESERQARALVGLDVESQRIVWELALKTAPGGTVTPEHVRTLAAVLEGVLAAGAIDDGTGEMVAWDSLTPNQRRSLLEANLSEETYERLQRQKAHVSRATGDHEWFSPAEFVEPARKVLGKIELDPCSTAVANSVIKASLFYDAQDDGLSREWKGRVWMNPPYSTALVAQFVDKLIAEFTAGRVPAAVALVNNATETEWFWALTAPASAICFPKGRAQFWHPDKAKGTPLQGQAIVYLGEKVATFHAAFSPIGAVWVKP